MKQTDNFDAFLTNSVNLGRLKLDLLDDRVDDVWDALKDDPDIGSDVLSKKRQGSWAQRTIIEPQRSLDFDADVMVRIRYRADWANEPHRYSDAVYKALKDSTQLAGQALSRKARCVRVQFSGMHVDVVPYVIRPDGTEAIINRDDDAFEATDPDAFTTWMKNRDDLADGNLRKVIRLMKYIRDHRGSFTGTRSIILTTLLGERVTAMRKILDASAYADVPTALLTIVTDLDNWLQGQTTMPPVLDPAGTGFDFTHRWSQESFSYFKDRMATHATQIHDAYHEPDPEESLKKWQDLFGDEFKAVTTSSSGKFTTGEDGPRAGVATSSINRTGRAG